MSDDAKGIVAVLKDLSFSEFITTRLIKLLYILGVLLITLSSVAFIIISFMRGFVPGIIGLIIGPLFFVVGVISIRVYLELIIVIFRIAENTGKMAGTDTISAAAPEAEKKEESKKEESSDDKDDEEKDKSEE